MKNKYLLAVILLICRTVTVSAQFTDLLNFMGTSGAAPYGSLTVSTTGDTIFGMTTYGGAYNQGNIFSFSGSGYSDLYDFSGLDGAYPFGSITLSVTGDTLFGMSSSGGIYNDGNIFSIIEDGSGFTDLYDFSGTDGAYPYGSLTRSITGDSLFGMTSDGGTSSYGNVFCITTSGGSYADLLDFNGVDGEYPYGSLVLSKGYLFGMTSQGGTSSYGNLFVISTNTFGHADLFDFNGLNGSFPYGSLTKSVSGDSLFGFTSEGGWDGDGDIFAYIPGTGFRGLYSFNGTDGNYPNGDLIVSGRKLYGMSTLGGGSGDGNIFSMFTDGSSYVDIFEFSGSTGEFPYGSLTFLNNNSTKFVGMTSQGGAYTYGIIFKYDILSASGLTLNNVTCLSGSVGVAKALVMGGVSPYNYNWSPGYCTTQIYNGLSAGSYTVVVTDRVGSRATSVAVISGVSVSISNVTNVICNGGTDGAITATLSGGIAPYAFTWSGGIGGATIDTRLSAGTYTVTVTDSCGATATASAIVTQPSLLRDSIVTSATVNVLTYGGHNGSATVGVTGGTSPYNYLWIPGGETTAAATTLIAGVYTVTVTDDNGCNSTASITITQPSGPITAIPISSDTCIYSDTMSTRERWYVVTPDSSSMSITITNLTPTGGHIHDVMVIEGMFPHTFPLAPVASLHNDTSSVPISITLNDLFVGIPIYISISRGHNLAGCAGCSPLSTAEYNLCTQNLTAPIRTVDANGNVFYNGGPQYKANQVIIKFMDSTLILSIINNPSIVSGTLSTFLRSAQYTSIVGYLTAFGVSSTTISGITLQKIFPTFTLADSVTTSLQGKLVHNIDLWATFLMTFPSGPTSTPLPYSEVQISRLLSLINGVGYAEPNPIGKLSSAPNDSYFSGQYNLSAGGGYTDCDINVIPAWTFSTGDPSYGIGVFDAGIDETHYDFNDGTYSNINSSNGYDYFYTGGRVLTPPYTTSYHGTCVAGIVAGIRDNSYGIAGVAGGDEVNGDPGCSLYDMKITDGTNYASGALIDQAIQEGWSTYSENIMNHSWGTINYSNAFRDAVSTVDHNGVVFVAARGNYPDFTPINEPIYPACLGGDQDYLSISVGSGGLDGQWLTTTNSYPTDGTLQSMTQFVNIIAPGSNGLVLGSQAFSTSDAIPFNGASAAAPQVSGVVGLMDSYLNTSLCIEDATNLIEMFATPTTVSGQTTFPNDYSGYGRLNAGWVLANLQSPNTLNHFASNDGSCTVALTSITVENSISINLPEPLNGLAAGTYNNVNVSDYQFTLSYSLPGPILSNSNNPGYWPRFSSTYGLSNVYPAMDVDNWCNIVSCNTTQAVVSTYVYDIPITGSPDVFLPVDLSQIAVAITIFTGNEQIDPVSVPKILNSKLNADIYPNPANEFTNIDYSLTHASYVKITIYSSSGALIEEFVNNNDVAGFHQKNISLSGFSSGLYLVEIVADNLIAQKKLLVIK